LLPTSVHQLIFLSFLRHIRELSYNKSLQDNTCKQRPALGKKTDLVSGKRASPFIPFFCRAALRLRHYPENRPLWLDGEWASLYLFDMGR